LSLIGGGTVRLDAAGSYTGGTTLAAGETLELGATAAAGSGAIDFGGAAVLRIEPGVAVANDIVGLGNGDAFDFVGVSDGALPAQVSFDLANKRLTVDGSTGGTVTLQFDLAGQYLPAAFHGSADAGGTGTTVSYVACFAAGTRIDTPGGPVPVETLRVGDTVNTACGAARRVVWLGHRGIDCRRHARPREVWPVRVMAGAFGARLPRRDLWLSPDHAVFVDDVLIPIRYLINGASVVQEAVGRVVYWHVELARHAVIVAEGLPCESYLDTGNRGAFGNGGGAIALHPDFALRIWETEACAKLALGGRAVTSVRRRLIRRAKALGFAVAVDPELHLLHGGVRIRPRMVAGGIHRFAVPDGADAVTVASRAGVPAELSATACDHRRLGVMVERIVLRRPGWRHELPLGAIPAGSGFHPLERRAGKAWRWTDGCARLGGLPQGGGLVIDLHLAAAQASWVGGAANGRVALAGRR
jgi:hypothetical protein